MPGLTQPTQPMRNVSYGGAGTANIPEENYAKLRAGINLFELRLPQRKIMDQEVYGPFDVKVFESEDAGQFEEKFHINWQTKRDAYIRYRVDGKGNGVGWMPDDIYWHNRLFLISGNSLNAVALHTTGGVISGLEVAIEIDCLRERLMEEVDITTILKNGREISHHLKKIGAEEEIEELRTANTQVKVGTDGVVKSVGTSKNKYELGKGRKLDFKEDIKKLMGRYRSKPFGWTQSEKFMEEIKPEIIENIKEKKSSIETGSAPTFDVKKAITMLSEEDREEIVKALTGKKQKEKVK